MNPEADQTEPKPTKSLLEDLRAMLATVPGAPERERLLALLPSARSFELSDELTTAISDTLSERPHTVEHKFDFLMLPEGVCWFEWSERARRTDVDVHIDEVEHPDRIGVMIAYANDDTKAVVDTVVWRFTDGRVDHAPAFF